MPPRGAKIKGGSCVVIKSSVAHWPQTWRPASERLLPTIINNVAKKFPHISRLRCPRPFNSGGRSDLGGLVGSSRSTQVESSGGLGEIESAADLSGVGPGGSSRCPRPQFAAWQKDLGPPTLLQNFAGWIGAGRHGKAPVGPAPEAAEQVQRS